MLSPLLGVPSLGFVVVKPRSADLREIARLVDRSLLRMPVAATYSLDEIGEAHDRVAAGHARGKRVLVVSPEAAGNASAGGELIAVKARSTEEDS